MSSDWSDILVFVVICAVAVWYYIARYDLLRAQNERQFKVYERKFKPSNNVKFSKNPKFQICHVYARLGEYYVKPCCYSEHEEAMSALSSSDGVVVPNEAPEGLGNAILSLLDQYAPYDDTEPWWMERSITSLRFFKACDSSNLIGHSNHVSVKLNGSTYSISRWKWDGQDHSHREIVDEQVATIQSPSAFELGNLVISACPMPASRFNHERDYPLCEVLITRAKDWKENDGEMISEDEWIQYLETDTDLVQSKPGSTTATLAKYVGKNATWISFWDDGTIRADQRYTDNLVKLFDIAEKLNARVVDYNSDDVKLEDILETSK